jgi:ATP-binding cassette, subfamily B, bacterial PglK
MRISTLTVTILNLFLRIWRHLSRRRKLQFFLVLVLMLVSALAEVISLGAVLPFIGALVSPDKVFNHPLVADVVQVLGITSADQLVLPFTIAFVAAALGAGAIRMLLLWVNSRLVFASGTDLSIAVYQRTLYQPYSVHIARNSSMMISYVTDGVERTVGLFTQLLILISSSVLLVAIMFALIAIDPIVASVAFTGFGACYGIITWLTRRRLERNSQIIAQKKVQVIKALQEGLGGIRDVLLDGTQPVYCEIYRKAEVLLKRAMASNLFIAGSPRYAMEALGICLITALAYELNNQEGGLANALPTLGALVLGTQRLLPALQQGYSAWTHLVGNIASTEGTVQLLEQSLADQALQTDISPLEFKQSIRLDNVCFRYSSDGPWVLYDLGLEITKGARVGFVGSTGSGKSTALDLLMGLLQPTEGEFLVDGQSLGKKYARAWQKNIAHVPQAIYLSDSTIAENIAFGVPLESIDMERVRQAAKQAQISDFIENQSEGYNVFVGERGVRLSGGQRQRIGIARAFYKKASLLVFDEATSALDNATERSVIKSLEELSRDITIILIAHRLTTIQHCDIVVELDDGKVVAQGTYEQLCESSPSFQKMTQKMTKLG